MLGSETDGDDRIAVVGYFGTGNARDDAIGTAVCERLAEEEGGIHVSVKADDVFEEYPVESFQLTPRQLFRQILRADRLVLTGGTHFHDYDGNTLRRLKVFLTFAAMGMFATVTGTSVYFVGHGVGPVRRRRYRWLLRAVFVWVDWISVRDEPSHRVADRHWCGDPVLAFDLAGVFVDGSNPGEAGRTEEGTLGVSVTPAEAKFFDAPERDDELVAELAAGIEAVVDDGAVERVRVFVFHTGTYNSDRALSVCLSEALSDVSVDVVEYDGDPRAFLRRVGECEWFVGMKYHSVVYAYLAGLPAITVPYHPKCRHLAAYVGYRSEAVVDPLSDPDVDVAGRLRGLVDGEPPYRATMPHDEAADLTERNFGIFQR